MATEIIRKTFLRYDDGERLTFEYVLTEGPFPIRSDKSLDLFLKLTKSAMSCDDLAKVLSLRLADGYCKVLYDDEGNVIRCYEFDGIRMNEWAADEVCDQLR